MRTIENPTQCSTFCNFYFIYWQFYLKKKQKLRAFDSFPFHWSNELTNIGQNLCEMVQSDPDKPFLPTLQSTIDIQYSLRYRWTNKNFNFLLYSKCQSNPAHKRYTCYIVIGEHSLAWMSQRQFVLMCTDVMSNYVLKSVFSLLSKFFFYVVLFKKQMTRFDSTT